MTEDTTVLIVEDQPDVLALYEQFVGEQYTVRTATTVEAAVDIVDESTDVVLLDRRLPDGDGQRVLERIREQGYGCRVAMVTGVVPDFDIVGMGFDHYVVKPISRDGLLDAVEVLLGRTEYGTKLRETASLVSKRALLEAEKSADELAASTEYRQLVDQVDTLQRDIDAISTDFTPADFRAMFRDIESAP